MSAVVFAGAITLYRKKAAIPFKDLSGFTFVEFEPKLIEIRDGGGEFFGIWSAATKPLAKDLKAQLLRAGAIEKGECSQ